MVGPMRNHPCHHQNQPPQPNRALDVKKIQENPAIKKKCAYFMANGKSMDNIFCKSNVMTWKDFLRDKKKLQGQMFYNKDPQQPPHSPNIITTFKSKHHCWSNARSIEL